MSINTLLGDPNVQLFVGAPQDRLTDMVELMVENGVNSVAIIDDKNHLIGVLTDHDIMRAIHSGNGALENAQVSKWMTKKVVTCAPETKLTEALKLMGRHGIRHLVVADGATPLVVIGIRAILAKIHEHDELEVNVLRDIAVATLVSNAA